MICVTCRKKIKWNKSYGYVLDLFNHYCYPCWLKKLIREARFKGNVGDISFWKNILKETQNKTDQEGCKK